MPRPKGAFSNGHKQVLCQKDSIMRLRWLNALPSFQKKKYKVYFFLKALTGINLLESIQSNGDIFESDIPQHQWLFEL